LLIFLELLGISGLVFAEPLFGMLRDGSANLVSFVVKRFDLALITGVILFGPAASTTAVLAVLGHAWPESRTSFRALALALFCGLFVVPFTKHSTHWPPAAIVVAAAATLLASWLVLDLVPSLRVLFLPLLVVPPAFAARFIRANRVQRVVLGNPPHDCADVGISARPRIVMVVLDELPEISLLDPSGNVDRSLFPSFAHLADAATWYRNTTTVAEHTHRALPAILTGRFPTAGLLPSYRDHPRNIFTLLECAGYRLNSFETLTQLSPAPQRSRWKTGWLPTIHQAGKLWRMYNSPKRGTREWFGDSREFGDSLAIGKRFVASLKPESAPVFDFLHVLLPHRPWHYLDGGRTYPLRKGENAQPPTWESADVSESARQRHLLQLQAADWLLGTILERLEAIDAFDDTLLIVTADHGIAFAPGRSARLSEEDTSPEVLWVPLFIKAPAQFAGGIDDRPVKTVDIVPTIVDHLGATVPWTFDGLSTLRASRRETSVGKLMFETELHDPSDPGAWLRSFDGPDGFRRVLSAAVGSSDAEPELRLYRLGVYGELVGTEVDRLTMHPERVVRGEFTSPSNFRHVDPDAAFLPWVSIAGRVTGAHDQYVAIAVNGRIAGLGRLGAQRGEAARYTAMVAPTLFVRGTNDVTAFLLSGDRGSPIAIPIRHDKRSRRL
jgi:Sulfatase